MNTRAQMHRKWPFYPQAEGTLRLVSFAREDLGECLDFVAEKCEIRRSGGLDGKPVIFSTGMGGFQYGKTIEDKLNIK